MEYIRIKYTDGKLISYSVYNDRPNDFYYSKTSGICEVFDYPGFITVNVNVHVPTYLNYIDKSHVNYFTITIIDSVIKQIKRKETINKLLNE